MEMNKKRVIVPCLHTGAAVGKKTPPSAPPALLSAAHIPGVLLTRCKKKRKKGNCCACLPPQVPNTAVKNI